MGRRENDNSSRIHFFQENQALFPVCREVVRAFTNLFILAALEKCICSDLSQGHLRMEYCQDVDGFWLERHLDISVKPFTMLICLSADPNLRDARTDLYDATPEHILVNSAAYEENKGLIFIPGPKTRHGFTKRPIKGLQRSLIVNYVSSLGLNQNELAYP